MSLVFRLTAAQCGRFFVGGLVLFWLLLLLIWIVPAQYSSLLQWLKWLWLTVFAITLLSYLLLLFHRLGIRLFAEHD
jgi:hypothetical protein